MQDQHDSATHRLLFAIDVSLQLWVWTNPLVPILKKSTESLHYFPNGVINAFLRAIGSITNPFLKVLLDSNDMLVCPIVDD